MKLYTETAPRISRPVSLPCIVLDDDEVEGFIGEDDARRKSLDREASALAETIQPAPEEVLVYDGHGAVVTGVAPGYRFVSAEAIKERIV